MKKPFLIDNAVVPVQEQFRIATLNMLHSNEHLEQRYAMLHEEITKINPDVLHIQEANFIGHEKYLNDFIKRHGYNFYHITPSSLTADPSRSSANLTLSKAEASFKVLPHISNTRFDKAQPSTLVTFTQFNGVPIITFNVHLAWGAKEDVRLKQIMQVEIESERLLLDYPNAIFIVAGDFNTEESNDTIRFLRGETHYHDYATFWVDSWKALGTSENHTTSEVIGILAEATSKAHNTHFPSLTPRRRIDYIFIKGWVYGRNGSPLNFHRWADSYVDGVSISDHYGVFVDLLVKN